MALRDEFQAVSLELHKVGRIAQELYAPHLEARERILKAYWNQGWDSLAIAEDTGLTRATVRKMLTQIEIDWRKREEPKPEPEPEWNGQIHL